MQQGSKIFVPWGGSRGVRNGVLSRGGLFFDLKILLPVGATATLPKKSVCGWVTAPGGARGACSEILGAPEPPLEPLSKKYGAQGGALGRPEIASEALEAIVKNVKKTFVFPLF